MTVRGGGEEGSSGQNETVVTHRGVPSSVSPSDEEEVVGVEEEEEEVGNPCYQMAE